MVAALVVIVTNLHGIATGDDGVGYRAIADSILRGDGLGYFLERPLTVWPPVWPALMAAVAWATPLSTTGAAVLLNAITVIAAVLVGHRLLSRFIDDERLVMLGTLVIGLGSSTIGFGHLLMTDFAFAVVIMAWLLTLLTARERTEPWWPAVAALWVWAAFGLRYVGVALIGIGGLWLLLDATRSIAQRMIRGALYGVVSIVVPVAWMLRNHAADGTWTGERFPSARGLIDNGFDILATLGRFELPGVANGYDKIWAGIGAVVLAITAMLAWKILGAPGSIAGIEPTGSESTVSDSTVSDSNRGAPTSLRLRRLWAVLGRGPGLLLLTAALYLLYMLYIRTTTALNQLDLRLLNPAYFSLLTLGLIVVDRTRRLGPDDEQPWHRRALALAYLWATLNLVAGLAGILMFVTGSSFFNGNYSSDTFIKVRSSEPVLAAIPKDCVVYSNLPNGLYPRLEAKWSPRRTGLESNEQTGELKRIIGTLDQTPSCLVWIDEEPRYGHLWTLSQLQQRLDLQQLSTSKNVTVYRMRPKVAS